MADLIKLICSDTRLCGSGNDIKNLSSKAADLAHTSYLLLIEDLNVVFANELLLRSWDAIESIVWLRNSVWNSSSRRQGVDRPQ